MDDLISRNAAIDALCKGEGCGNICRRGIERIPSAERRGRWIRTGEDGYCSVCKCDMPMFRNDWEWEYTETPYCPNCGAKMEGEEE